MNEADERMLRYKVQLLEENVRALETALNQLARKAGEPEIQLKKPRG